MSGVGGSHLGYNQFAYCFNNPVNMSDQSGNWPKWLSGTLNVISGTAQAVIGSAIGVAASWTGFGAVVGAALVLNGAATVTQGFGQLYNAVTQTNTMREDNVLRTGVQDLGRAVAGDTGAAFVGMVYDAAIIAATLYVPSSPTATPQPAPYTHSTGVVSPKNARIVNGAYTQIGSNGKLYSYTQFDSFGRQSLRIDFQGKAHAGALPHIHLFIYPERGGRVEYIFDTGWNLLNK